jgi:four helix bundle protein
LVVWQKSIKLAVAVYDLTRKFPKEEQYGLISQIRRATVSVSSNIAEGKLRSTRKEFRQFLFVAFGSGGELETQIEIAKNLPETNSLDYKEVDSLLSEIMKMLNKLISSLKLPNA